jgi:hypothetical protein
LGGKFNWIGFALKAAFQADFKLALKRFENWPYSLSA